MDDTRRRILKTGLLGGAAVASGLEPGESHAARATRIAGETLRVLVLGGTGFIGPHMVSEALRRGHEVSLFNRGRTNPGLFPDVEHHRGSRDGGLDALSGGAWDVAIDNSGFLPGQVRDSARLLARLASRYIFLSTVAVYERTTGAVSESSAVRVLNSKAAGEVTPETYGALKADCEKEVMAAFGERRTTILRPALVCGPGDRTDRYTYWPVRAAEGGRMLWPGSPEDRLQFIDARDLANFAIDCAERPTSGVFNAATPAGRYTMGGLLDDCCAVTGASVRAVWADLDFLAGEGACLPIREVSGRPVDARPEIDSSRAVAAGLRIRPTRETARDTLAWWKSSGQARVPTMRTGITQAREQELLARWDARSG